MPEHSRETTPHDSLFDALERIAWPEFDKDSNGHPMGCRCGHRYDFCHAANAAHYCGGDALRAQQIARQALGYADEHGLATDAGRARHAELVAGEETFAERLPRLVEENREILDRLAEND